jgi:hypothetical protein
MLFEQFFEIPLVGFREHVFVSHLGFLISLLQFDRLLLGGFLLLALQFFARRRLARAAWRGEACWR